MVYADLPSWKVVKNAYVNSGKCLNQFFKLGRSAYDSVTGISIGCMSLAFLQYVPDMVESHFRQKP